MRKLKNLLVIGTAAALSAAPAFAQAATGSDETDSLLDVATAAKTAALAIGVSILLWKLGSAMVKKLSKG